MAGEMDTPQTGSSDQQAQALKKSLFVFIPVRLVIALSLFSLSAGGPGRFFVELPGQVFAGLFCLQIIAERIFRPLDLGGQLKDRRTRLLLWLTIGGAYMAAMLDYFWLRPHWSLLEYSWAWVVAGAAVFLVGQTLRVVSMRRLGRFFTASVRVHEGQRVIKEGIYSRVRHPSYLGLFLVSAGFVTLFGSVIGYAVLLLAGLPGLLRRIKVEEEALTRELGDEYREYCKKTKRLIPGIF
jgi:protein-S-isoprenylcysteine O-methyltransferase Ste14